MNCPLFVDFTRECLDKIEFLPQDTFEYCVSDKHIDCPFYRALKNIGAHCEYIDKCVAYKYFGAKDFEKFVEITKSYCLCPNNVKCARFKIKSSGEVVPEDLLPDGSTRPSEG